MALKLPVLPPVSSQCTKETNGLKDGLAARFCLRDLRVCVTRLCGGEETSLLDGDADRRTDVQSATRPLPSRHRTSHPGGAKSRVSDDCDESKSSGVETPREISPPKLNVRKEDKKFSCNYCNKIFKYKGNFCRHMRTIHKISADLYKCNVCGAEFKLWGELMAHKERYYTMSDNNDSPPYKCSLCGALFKTKNDVQKHAARTHCVLKFACGICSNKFKTIQSLRDHTDRYHNNGEKHFICDLCGASSKNKLDIYKHITHAAEFKYLCNICGKIFNSMEKLGNHINRHHNNGARPFKCNFCGLSFKARADIYQHIKFTHGDIKYTCSSCKRKFKRKSYLKYHNERYHSNSARPYKCSLCGSSFKTKSDVHNHKKITHSNVRNFSCSYCTKKFKTSSVLSLHVKIHENSPRIQCDQCSATLKTKQSFTHHKLFVHSVVPKLSCDECERQFKYKESLRDHMDSKHSGGLCRYKCNVCQDAFKTLTARNVHVRNVHTNVKSLL